MEKLKTKRYTYTHIQRVLMNVLINVRAHNVKRHPAVRILGMNDTGRNYLKYLKINFLSVNLSLI